MTSAEAFKDGVSAQRRGDYAEAERLYRLAIEFDPNNADHRLNLGVLLRTTGRANEARAVLEGGVTLAPQRADLQWALGVTLLALGDYRAGWPLYERRREIFGISSPKLPFPEWTGQSLAGKRIVVLPEQGLGDAIQFSRFLLRLPKCGASVLLLSKPSLSFLFANSFPGIEVQPLSGQIDLGGTDYWVSIMSLAHRLDVQLENLLAEPYLRAPSPEPHREGCFRVGLMTQGNTKNDNDVHRSLGPDHVRRLQALQDVEVVSLHPEDSGDFEQTANIIAGLDLVISVDTSIGHLAGALGKPTFLLTPGIGADWRWMAERDDSPWYPHHRLFRGAANGDWSPALDRLTLAVAQLRASTLTKSPPPPT